MGLYKISNVVQHTAKVRVIQIEYWQGQEIVFTPGQYVDINFANDRDQLIDKYTSFSVSSSPFEKKILEIVVLDLGAFRHRLYNSPIGTALNVNGPYGKFIYYQDKRHLPVFVAGGSGIAPIMSMLRHIDKKYPETQFFLFYTCKTENDIIFFKELKDLTKSNKTFQCHFVVTRDTKNKFNGDAENKIQWESGHIDESMIIKSVKDISSKAYYICGPYEMMIMVSFILQKLGVDSSNIRSELW